MLSAMQDTVGQCKAKGVQSFSLFVFVQAVPLLPVIRIELHQC